MMQGDSYGLKISIVSDNITGTPGQTTDRSVTPDYVSDVEITVGIIRKTYAKGEVFYESGQGWIVPLTQDETFKLPAARVKAQVRVVWKDGSVEGASLGEIRVDESISKVVL